MIYRPINFTLENKSVDATVDNIITCEIDGDFCDAYQLRLYEGNTLIYDSTKITLAQILYDGEILSITLPQNTTTNGKELLYTVEVFEGATNKALSSYIQFYTNQPPSVSLTFTNPIASQSLLLQATYSQVDGITMAEYTYDIKDATGNILFTNRRIGTQDTRYTVEGFVNGQSGTIEFRGITTRGQIFTTGVLPFAVSYSQPNININPSTTVDKITSLVTFDWGEITQITGVATGTYQFVDDFITVTNKGLHLDNGSILKYTLDFGEEFTAKFKLKLTSGFDGKICELTGESSEKYGFYYDLATTTFYWDNDGVIISSLPITLPVNSAYIVILPQMMYIKILNIIYELKL